METYFPPLSCEWVDFSKSFAGHTCLSGWKTLEAEMIKIKCALDVGTSDPYTE